MTVLTDDSTAAAGRVAPLRIAIAHDYLTQRGGAEKVVLTMSRLFPEAPIHTLLYDPANTYPEFAERDIRVSPLNRIGPLRRDHRKALPFLPFAASATHIDADVVLTSSSGWAHGFRSTGKKLIFCHSPARWLYLSDLYLGENAGGLERAGLSVLDRPLRSWDRRAARSCDRYLAVSSLIKQRIADAYGIAADVVPSPVAVAGPRTADVVSEVQQWTNGAPDEAFYLCVSRLLPYKNVAQVVSAFADGNRRLVVVGRGPQAAHIRESATDNVMFLSDLTDGQMSWLYQHCKATIAASYEDFGLTPIEAGSWGRPSAVLRWGGFLDTVAEGVTGVFFDTPTPAAIAEALDRLERHVFHAEQIRAHMEQFSEARFGETLREAVSSLAAGIPA